MTYVGVGVNIAVRVGHDQHVNVHGVQKGGQRGICTIICGNLTRTQDTDFVVMFKNDKSYSATVHVEVHVEEETLYKKLLGRNAKTNAPRQSI